MNRWEFIFLQIHGIDGVFHFQFSHLESTGPWQLALWNMNMKNHCQSSPVCRCWRSPNQHNHKLAELATLHLFWPWRVYPREEVTPFVLFCNLIVRICSGSAVCLVPACQCLSSWACEPCVWFTFLTWLYFCAPSTF